MNHIKLGKTFAMGIIMTVVLATISFILIKLYGMAEKLLRLVAQFLAMERIFGEIIITCLAILTIIIFILVLGYISMRPAVSRYKDKLEYLLIEIYPPLNYFKVWADEKLKVDIERANWKPVLALVNDQYLPAVIVEENEEWTTLTVLHVPNSDPSGIMIVRKGSLQLIPMTMSQMLLNNRVFGKGHLSLIPPALEKQGH